MLQEYCILRGRVVGDTGQGHMRKQALNGVLFICVGFCCTECVCVRVRLCFFVFCDTSLQI